MTEEIVKEDKDLTEEEINELKYKKRDTEKKMIDRVIKGVNDVWTKEYNFEELDLKFSISIKAPNAIEQGKIQVKREQYLGGMGTTVPNPTFVAYQALATIRVCGVDVPKELAVDEDIYNTAILVQIGLDFQDWLNTFRY